MGEYSYTMTTSIVGTDDGRENMKSGGLLSVKC